MGLARSACSHPARCRICDGGSVPDSHRGGPHSSGSYSSPSTYTWVPYVGSRSLDPCAVPYKNTIQLCSSFPGHAWCDVVMQIQHCITYSCAGLVMADVPRWYTESATRRDVGRTRSERNDMADKCLSCDLPERPDRPFVYRQFLGRVGLVLTAVGP